MRGRAARLSSVVTGLWRSVVVVLGTRIGQGLGVVLGLVGVLAVAVSGSVVAPPAGGRRVAWWFALPGSWPGSATGTSVLEWVFDAGLVLLGIGWLVLGAGVCAHRWSVGRLWLVAALWGLPLFAAPVALSTDPYTYLGQGLVAHAGWDPYSHGPSTVVLPPEVAGGISGWLNAPSPYGPGFVWVAETIAPLSWNSLVAAVLALRLVAVVGLALTAAALPRLARASGGDPVRATWLGVTSPLVLGSFVLSGHNDALMVGLLAAGVALATRGGRFGGVPGPLAGIAVCALAAMVKAPAAVGVVFLAVAWVRRAPGFRSGVGRLVAVAATTACVAALVSLLAGVGTSWLSGAALASPARAATPFTPVINLGWALNWGAHQLGLLASQEVITLVVQRVGVLAAGAFGLALLWREPRLGLVRALGLALLAAVLVSPIVWPWYLCWAVVLLAAVPPSRRGFLLTALAAASLLLLRPDGDPVDLPRALTLVLAAGLLTGAIRTLHWSCRHLVRSRPHPESPSVCRPGRGDSTSLEPSPTRSERRFPATARNSMPPERRASSRHVSVVDPAGEHTQTRSN